VAGEGQKHLLSVLTIFFFLAATVASETASEDLICRHIIPIKGSHLTHGVSSHRFGFDGLAYYTVPGKLFSVAVVLQPHLLLWDLS